MREELAEALENARGDYTGGKHSDASMERVVARRISLDRVKAIVRDVLQELDGWTVAEILDELGK